MGAAYRVSQFLRALGARLTPAERAWAQSLLTPAAFELFAALPRQDQRHGMDVALALRDAGVMEPAVLAAALLHDAGKARSQLTLFHRTAMVLLQAGRPALLHALGDEEQEGWRRPFWVHLHHPEIGAELAEAAGCAELTVWLIGHHHRPAEETADAHRRAWLELFQNVDNSH
ncbi:MAG: HD domain-containing protein [Anaerolineae bacterium]